MVCALDEDQVGEFVPALHNISAQYHVDRAHSRRLVSVSIPPALNVSPRGLAKSTKAGRSEAASLFDSLFRADPRGFAIGLVHPFTNLAQTLPVEVKPSHGPLSKRLTATSSPRRETIRSSYCYSSLAVIGAATQHVALCISSRLHLAQGIP